MARPTSLYALPHLAAWRKKRYMTQEQLAEKSGLTRTAIARLESKGTAKIATVTDLATALGITREELIEVDPAKKANK